MIRNPRPPSGVGDILRWAREVAEFLTSLIGGDAPNTLTSRTTRGTSRSALAGSDGVNGTADIGEIRQWDAGIDYVKDQLAFADTVTERADGQQGGLYQALEDVTGGSHPSVSASWILVARWHWDLLTFRNGTGKVEIDVTAAAPVIRLYNDYSSAAAGSIILDTNDIPVTAGDKIVKVREDTFCVGPNLKKITWIATDPYDP